jgi:hypothetical protein
MQIDALMSKGSKTAKKGFRTEKDVADALNHWETNTLGRRLLENMRVDLEAIKGIAAAKDLPHTAKPDLSVRISLKNDSLITHLVSVKEAKKAFSFNHLHKVWVDSFSREYDLPEGLRGVLKQYVGEVSANGTPIADGQISGHDAKRRRRYLNLIPHSMELAAFFRENRQRMIETLLLGKGEYKADYLLAVLEDEEKSERLYVLVTDRQAIDFFGQGDARITGRGNLSMGRITLQRKGGDAGLPSANMLQFKISPASLLKEYRPIYVEKY